jgi:glycosyltransferase involved in cell wall biosynthesis
MKKKYNIPFVVTEHATTYFKHSHDNYFERGFPFRYVTGRTFSDADAVASVSCCLMNILDELFVIKRKYLIRNSVNTSLFFPVEIFNSVKRFVHVSMMVPFKNIEGILRGLAHLNMINRNWQMNFIGPAAIDHFKLAVELGLEKQITWKGTLAYHEVAKEMQQADALVHFSKYENLPCVVSEALCCGLPVISSNVGGIAELVNDSNGILVGNENIDQLADAMATFLQNPDRFNKQQISTVASAQFNYETIGEEIVGMYNEVLKQN